MNNKGNIFLGAVVALMVFMLSVLFIPFMKDDVTTTRTDLNCSNVSAITDGTKLTCLFVDGVIPYFIWAFISIALGAIVSRV